MNGDCCEGFHIQQKRCHPATWPQPRTIRAKMNFNSPAKFWPTILKSKIEIERSWGLSATKKCYINPFWHVACILFEVAETMFRWFHHFQFFPCLWRQPFQHLKHVWNTLCVLMLNTPGIFWNNGELFWKRLSRWASSAGWVIFVMQWIIYEVFFVRPKRLQSLGLFTRCKKVTTHPLANFEKNAFLACWFTG